MQAACLENGLFTIEEVPDPIPGRNEVLVSTLACGICGSDLHQVVRSKDRAGRLVMGHEFCAEIIDYGPDTSRPFPVGSRVVSFPYVPGPNGAEIIGYSQEYPGGFGQRMVLSVADLVRVPDGISPTVAALTEPLAVGEHAVALGRQEPGDVATVIGCGPIGLAVIVALRRRGCSPIIAADFSAERRALAEKLGADIVFDPARASPYSAWKDYGADWEAGNALVAYATREKRRRAVIYECVGAPGLIAASIAGAPIGSTIVVVGACMGEDQFVPSQALIKGVELRFSAAYSHDEFAATLRRIADSALDASAIITREVTLQEVDSAVTRLATPTEGKITIRHE